MIRRRELEELIPRLGDIGIEVQLVTSAACPIPPYWAGLQNLHIVVSVDGLQPEHDARRAPATYARILKHIAGHQVIIHCTITKQMLAHKNYLRDFAQYWCGRPETRKIWFSFFTPQEGEVAAERLLLHERMETIHALSRLRAEFAKVYLPEVVLSGYRTPPASPRECVFAQVTTCVSPDLQSLVTPCQLITGTMMT